MSSRAQWRAAERRRAPVEKVPTEPDMCFVCHDTAGKLVRYSACSNPHPNLYAHTGCIVDYMRARNRTARAYDQDPLEVFHVLSCPLCRNQDALARITLPEYSLLRSLVVAVAQTRVSWERVVSVYSLLIIAVILLPFLCAIVAPSVVMFLYRIVSIPPGVPASDVIAAFFMFVCSEVYSCNMVYKLVFMRDTLDGDTSSNPHPILTSPIITVAAKYLCSYQVYFMMYRYWPGEVIFTATSLALPILLAVLCECLCYAKRSAATRLDVVGIPPGSTVSIGNGDHLLQFQVK